MAADDEPNFQDDGEEALRRLLLPTEYNDKQLGQLADTAYDIYRDENGEPKEDLLVRAFNITTLNALDYAVDDLQPNRTHGLRTPGELIYTLTFGAIAIKQYDGFQSLVETGYTEKIRPLQDVRDYFARMARALLNDADTISPDTRGLIVADLTSNMYEKQETEWGHDPVNAVTTLEKFEMDDGSTRTYMRFPMIGAHPEMLYYDNETGAENPEDLDVIFRDNSVFVPIEKYHEDFENGYGQKIFDYFLDLQERRHSEEDIEYIHDNATQIYERLDSWANTGNEHRLYRNHNPDKQALTAVRRAVKTVHGPSEDGYTSDEVVQGIVQYEPEEDWIEHHLSDFNTKNPRSTAQRLKSIDAPIEVINEPGTPNRYVLNPTSDHEIAFEGIEDLFELPCLKALDEDLQQREDAGPVRWELFTFVRMLMWLPPYYDRSTGDIDIDLLVKDIKQFFNRRYPWYDPQKTDYQVRYEYQEGERKGRYASPNCGNKHIKNYCIGQEKCDYTIYGAIDFPEEMFDNLPENDTLSL